MPTPFVFIGNNRYEIEGSRMGARARVDGGRLWVCRAPHAGPGTLLRLAVQGLLGRVPAGRSRPRRGRNAGCGRGHSTCASPSTAR